MRRSQQEIDRHWQLVMLLPNQAPGVFLHDLSAALEQQGHTTDYSQLQQDLIAISATIPLASEASELGTRYWIALPFQSAISDSRSRVASSSGNMTFASSRC
jgi:hypothetical protein